MAVLLILLVNAGYPPSARIHSGSDFVSHPHIQEDTEVRICFVRINSVFTLLVNSKCLGSFS